MSDDLARFTFVSLFAFTVHPSPFILPRRSSSMTGAVAGRTPRQMKNDSAACSTSIPSPSASVRPASGRKLQERGFLP